MLLRRIVFCEDFKSQRLFTVSNQLLHLRSILQEARSQVLGNEIVHKLRYCTVLVEKARLNSSKSKEVCNSRSTIEEVKSDQTRSRILELDKLSFCNDPDKFGTLSKESLLRNRLENLPEEDDKEVVEYVDGKEGNTRLRTVQYSKIIQNFLREKKLKEALDVLEIRMKKEKAKPDEYLFRLLISGCAKVGYTKKAFQLFNQMKKRGLKVKSNVYTSLFDACATSPWPSDGIKRAQALWNLMVEKRIELNQMIAHAAIKAFGRCGDLERAFSVVDEMSSQEVLITSETINFLLQACASDKEAGFRHAMIVWRKMLDRNIIPTTFTYNLLLRCTRDCSIGDPNKFKEDLSAVLAPSQLGQLHLLGPAEKQIVSQDESSSHEESMNEVVENTLLSSLQPRHTSFNCLIHLEKIVKPWHRLMIIGGREGFINLMLKTGAEPDIKTFTQMLFIIAPNVEEEQLLITEMKRQGIKMDVDFCNMLIKKRNMHNNFKEAKEVLAIMREEQLIPNIVTFGVLALGCTNIRDIKMLIRDIKDVGFRLNIQIMGTLLCSSCRTWDFKAIHYLVRLLIKLKIEPNVKFMEHLWKLDQDITNHIERKKRGMPHSNKLEHPNFEKEYEDFKQLITYVKSMEVVDSISVHPWSQFKSREIGVEET